ncbi:hypothetical protein BDZ45DRAFT_688415 [Acephala macrosclerotiorum]|nr:hypothetical protein BDZ45DRAFT_688415 [Acephala macrosclerotiorum]
MIFRQTALLTLALLPFSLAQVSEGFESGWDQTAWPTYSPNCNQGGKVTLDRTTAHGGKNSIRVDGAGGFCGYMLFGTNKIPSGDVYIKAYVKKGNQLHNRESNNATLPKLSPQSIAAFTALPTGAWECFEYHLGTDGTIETWLNGNTIASLTSKAGVANSNAAQWQRVSLIPKITGVYFG